MVFTPTVVLAPDPRETLLATDAAELVPSAMALVFEATALLPTATVDAALAEVPPMPIANELVPVAVPLAKAVFWTKYGRDSVPVTVRLFKNADVFTYKVPPIDILVALEALFTAQSMIRFVWLATSLVLQ